MNNEFIEKKYIPFIGFVVLLLAILACGSNTNPVLVIPTVSSIPKKATQINGINLTATSVYTALPSPTATSVFTSVPSLTATLISTTSPTSTPDPYMWIGGDWPNGIWDYIFKHERGARGPLKVYMGVQKSYIFEIIGAAECSSMPSGQGYLVRYTNGNEEWKDRRAMENYELFVLKDEFSDILINFNYKFYQCP